MNLGMADTQVMLLFAVVDLDLPAIEVHLQGLGAVDVGGCSQKEGRISVIGLAGLCVV
jgi:hypothetical protein